MDFRNERELSFFVVSPVTLVMHDFFRNSLCPLQRAVLRAVSTMLSALAGGWG